MVDFLVALALLLVIEGLVLAIAPALPRRMLEAFSEMPQERLRLGGLFSAALGVFLVWLLRG